MGKVTVHRNGAVESEYEHTASDGTLLESLQNNKTEVLYHCKEGFCGACRCKLKAGAVTYINEPLAFVRKGEILTCCSKPSDGQDIEIELL